MAIHYPKNLTLAELETTVNTDEFDNGQVQSLEAVRDSNGKEVTEAKYDETTEKDGNISIKKVVITSVSGKNLVFTGSAFDSNTAKDINVFR